MKQLKDKAIVLSRVDYGEKDRILTVLAHENGKVSVLAKGTRSQKSKLAGGIELMSESEVSFVEGKSSLKTLTSARLVQHFGNLVKDIHRLNQAFEFLKIINKVADEGSGQEFYETLLIGLGSLDDQTSDSRIVQVWFNLHVLNQAGSTPDLRAKNDDQKHFEFDYDKQCFVASSEGIFTQNDLKLLRLCQTGSKPPKLAKPTDSEDRLVLLANTLLKTNLTEV